jgi:hypothetical protein
MQIMFSLAESLDNSNVSLPDESMAVNVSAFPVDRMQELEDQIDQLAKERAASVSRKHNRSSSSLPGIRQILWLRVGVGVDI